jgi:hypothetical protein
MKKIPNRYGFGFLSEQHIEAVEQKTKNKKRNTAPTNELTKQVIKAIRASGGYAVRINTTGFYKEDLGKWINGTTTKGTADVHACLFGKHLSLEIKVGSDTQSEDQKDIENQVLASGGVYLLVKTLEGFMAWLQNFKKECSHE